MKVVGYLALAVLSAAAMSGAAANSELVKCFAFGLTLVVMPVAACALMASIAFPKSAITDGALALGWFAHR